MQQKDNSLALDGDVTAQLDDSLVAIVLGVQIGGVRAKLLDYGVALVDFLQNLATGVADVDAIFWIVMMATISSVSRVGS